MACLAIGLLMGVAGTETGWADRKMEEAPLVGGLKDLKALNRQLIDMAEPSSAATVSLVSKGGGGAGSGVIVSEDGLILTAAHVVAAMSEDVIVIFPDGTRKPAKSLGADFDRDAAMVQITEEGVYPCAGLADSTALRRNEWCVALGHPGGFDPNRTPPLRLGRILRVTDFVVTDCAVVGGDSGGPLFDVEGKVIGIHSNIGATLSENRHVPVSVYREQWDALKEGKRTGRRFAGKPGGQNPNRPMLGVTLGDPGESGGVVLSDVMEGSPAAKAGLQSGDVVLSVNGKKTDSAGQLIKVVSGFKPGKTVTVALTRNGERQEVEVKLTRWKDLEKKERPEEKKEHSEEQKDEGQAPKGENDDEAKNDDDRDDLDRYLDKALNGKSGSVKLELTPDDVERFGGMDRIMKRVKERMGEKVPEAAEEKAEEKADEEAPKPANEVPKADKAADVMKELLEQALKNDGRLELTPDKLDELGGMQEFAKRLRQMTESMDPADLQKLMKGQVTMAPDAFFESSMKALEPVVSKTAGATVDVLVDGKSAVLGTVVAKEGWIVTKDTETQKGKISVKIGEETVPAQLLGRFPKRDLALFQVDAEGLRPVRWAKTQREMRLGSLLTAAGTGSDPLGIGLVSVKTRPLAGVGFLGVQTSAGEDGVMVERTVDGGPAAKAGLKKGDVIVGIEGKKAGEPHEFGQLIRGYKVGDEVNLEVRTGEETRAVKVKLAERPSAPATGRFERMNEMSGPMSERQTGFPEALQHDIPLDPAQCGGPLLDLGGRCVGINVSRAGRVKTLAIPASDVRELLASVKVPEKEVEAAEVPSLTGEERVEIEKLLEDVRETLKDLEKRLEKMETR